jgi:2-C-methyl-D-erythritol 4-phosphate cytidylyltransferase
VVEQDGGSVGGVVLAAGSGSRLGAGRPKALLEVGGRPLVAWAVGQLAAAGIAPPVVVIPDGQADRFATALDGCEVAALVPGGETRTASVRAGVAALDREHEVVALHDAARPLVPVEVVRRVLAAMVDDVRAAAPGLPVSDTLKRVSDGCVLGTVDREELVGVQTPQAFPRGVLDAVLATDEVATDELALVERWIETGRLTGRVVVVPGSVFAHKVTYPDDLALVTALVQANRQGAP